jgi:glycosyltransferase involved in cell wall biosynthesis
VSRPRSFGEEGYRHRGRVATETAVPRRLCVLFHESELLGAGMSVLRVVERLGEYGWATSGWFPAPGPLPQEASSLLHVQTHGRRPIAFSLSGWRRAPGVLSRLRQTPGYVLALRRALLDFRPHVVHANSILSVPEALVAHALGFPVVLQIHELPNPGRKRDSALRLAVRIADLVIGVSEAVSDMLREQARSTPVITIRNGVPLPDSFVRSEAPHAVGTIGHVSKTKGTDVFLASAKLALRARPRLRFEHIGPARLWGDDKFDDHVEELANEPPLREALKMLGQQPASEGLKRWSSFVLPSRREAFPLSTLEAMAASLPVIATSVGGVPEQIVHMKSGILVPPERPELIADWIVRLDDEPDLRLRLGEEGRKRVAARFTLEAQAKALHEAYLSVLGMRRRSPQARRDES